MDWQKSLRGTLKINEQLARHTSLKIGGPVQYWFEPKDLSDLQNLVNLAHKKRMPLRIIGAGSNILIDDRGIKGIVVRLSSPYFKRIAVYPTSSTKEYRIKVGKGKRRVNQRVISAGAGVSLSRLLRYVQKKGLAGFELLAGIPGTVGGALIMNAGNIGDRVLDVTVMDKQARVKILNRKETQFSYRSSNLEHYIISGVHFKLIKKNKKAVKNRINKYLDYRQKTQDLSWPSAGCFFKNPDSKSVLKLRSAPMASQVKPSAAYFIERCGLKGSFIGDAAVSYKHANFIINKGRASFADILRLMVYIIRCVKKRFNLDLEPEIKIWQQV